MLKYTVTMAVAFADNTWKSFDVRVGYISMNDNTGFESGMKKLTERAKGNLRRKTFDKEIIFYHMISYTVGYDVGSDDGLF